MENASDDSEEESEDSYSDDSEYSYEESEEDIEVKASHEKALDSTRKEMKHFQNSTGYVFQNLEGKLWNQNTDVENNIASSEDREASTDVVVSFKT